MPSSSQPGGKNILALYQPQHFHPPPQIKPQTSKDLVQLSLQTRPKDDRASTSDAETQELCANPGGSTPAQELQGAWCLQQYLNQRENTATPHPHTSERQLHHLTDQFKHNSKKHSVQIQWLPDFRSICSAHPRVSPHPYLPFRPQAHFNQRSGISKVSENIMLATYMPGLTNWRKAIRPVIT